MKKTVSGLLLSIAILLFTANLHAQSKAISDESVDFSKYTSYSFLGWQKHSDSVLNDLDKKRLHDAFKSEFDARNLSYVESGGDMSVSLFLFISEETDYHTYLVYNQSKGYDSTMIGYGALTTTTHTLEDDYRVGTLILDCYENEDNLLVFQGIKEKTIEENIEKREKSIPKAVAKLMKNFPIKKVKK